MNKYYFIFIALISLQRPLLGMDLKTMLNEEGTNPVLEEDSGFMPRADAEYIQSFRRTFTINSQGIIQDQGTGNGEKLNATFACSLIENQRVRDLCHYRYSCSSARNSEGQVYRANDARRIYKDHVHSRHGGDESTCGKFIAAQYRLHHVITCSCGQFAQERGRIEYKHLEKHAKNCRSSKTFNVQVTIQPKAVTLAATE